MRRHYKPKKLLAPLSNGRIPQNTFDQRIDFKLLHPDFPYEEQGNEMKGQV